MSKSISHTKASSAPKASEYDANPGGIAVGLTLSMSWQLAVVVLLPVVGGHMLDNHLHPHGTPIYTLIGLLLAIAGMIGVVRRTLAELNKHMQKSIGEKQK